VILAEPSPTPYDLRFTLLGFPVRIHPTFLIPLFLLNLNASFKEFLMWGVAVVLCILLHELGHAIVMQSYGYHASIVLYSFGGLAIPHPGPRVRRPGPWGNMLISFAGPASGFILVAVLLLALQYLGGYQIGFYFYVVPMVHIPNHDILQSFLFYVFQISVLWGLLNLLPIYPLDGSQIAYQVLVLTYPHDATRQSLILSVIVGGMMVVIALAKLHDYLLVVFFIYLTYSSFAALQSYRGGGGTY